MKRGSYNENFWMDNINNCFSGKSNTFRKLVIYAPAKLDTWIV